MTECIKLNENIILMSDSNNYVINLLINNNEHNTVNKMIRYEQLYNIMELFFDNNVILTVVRENFDIKFKISVFNVVYFENIIPMQNLTGNYINPIFHQLYFMCVKNLNYVGCGCDSFFKHNNECVLNKNN